MQKSFIKFKFLTKSFFLITVLALLGCGGSGGGGSSTPAPNTDGGNGGGGNPDETPTTKISISEATGDEGGMITFKVIATPPITKQITFRYEATVDNTTTAGEADLSGKLTGNGTIATNDSSTTISIAIANDSLRENAETFMVMLSNLSPSDATFTDHTAIGTILANDDATGIVTISLVTDATASKENTGRINFQVSSEFTAISPFTFNYAVDLNNSSADTDDFAGATNGMANIPAGKDSTTISIRLKSDTMVEPDETFKLLLTNPTSPNATIDSAKNSAMGTILNDDLGEISDATAIIGDEKITLNWANPDSNIFAGVVIAQTTSTDAPLNCASATNVTIIDAQQKTSDTIEDLTNGIAYSFRICAKSKSGSLSGGFPLPNLIPLPTVDNNGNGLIDITTATQLNNMRHNLDATSYKTSGTAAGFTKGCPTSGCNGYELMNDIINLSSVYSNWIPIGINSDGNFRNATFDGNNYTISGLAIDRESSNDVGLFSAIQNATIRNLKLTDIRITGNDNVGALVGQATGTTLSNIELIGDANQESSNAEIKGTGGNVGGFVGSFAGTITDSTSSLTVRGGSGEAADRTGGLVGQLQSGGSIKNSNSSGSVSASNSADDVGGLVGQNGGTISNSWASGNVSSNGRNSWNYGGLVGGNSGTVSNSWASGNISTNGIDLNDNYGGLVGRNSGNINNSWANGNVSGSSNGGANDNYGGLVGQASNGSTISNSWASGNVSVISDNDEYGGLVGQNSGTISNSWASGNVPIANSHYGGLVGHNTGAGSINGRNYQVDGDAGIGVNLVSNGGDDSFVLGNGNRAAGLRALENLSGDASGTGNASYGTHSNWHAGFNAVNTQANLLTRFCDTNQNGTIDGTPDGQGERTANNSVWVMPPTANNVSTDTNEAGDEATYYQIPAIRCIGDTKGKTPTEISDIRKANIDRQRRLFPQ